MSSVSLQKYSAAAALVLGALAIAAGSPDAGRHARVSIAELATAVEREEDHVTAVELAMWIRDRRHGLRIVDVRDSAGFESYHIPTAEHIAMNDVASARFGVNETIVLYSEGGAHAAQAWVFLRALGNRQVYFLRGGLYEWIDEVMNPSLAADATDSTRNQFDRVAELSRYFGGVPRTGEPLSSRPSLPIPGARREPVVKSAAVERVRGRGC